MESKSNPPILTLRPFKLTDVEVFILWAGDDRATKNIRWERIASNEEGLKFIAEICIPHPWRRSICLNDRSIGFVSVYPGSGDDMCKADIGYAVGAENWGKRDSPKLAVRQVFDDLPQGFCRRGEFGLAESIGEGRISKGRVAEKIYVHKRQIKRFVRFSIIPAE